MAKDIIEVLLNPIRMRIIQLFADGTREKMTAAEICEVLNDIPRTTLYRHINVLIDANVLNIVSERKVRGSLERTLAINVAEFQKLQGTQVENAPQLTLSFLMTVYAKFEKYYRKHNGKPQEGDILFFVSSIMMLTDEEFKNYLTEIGEVDKKYTFEDASGGRRPRDITFIVAPPDDDVKHEERSKEASDEPN